jgi:hypothetical protein
MANDPMAVTAMRESPAVATVPQPLEDPEVAPQIHTSETDASRRATGGVAQNLGGSAMRTAVALVLVSFAGITPGFAQSDSAPLHSTLTSLNVEGNRRFLQGSFTRHSVCAR